MYAVICKIRKAGKPKTRIHADFSFAVGFMPWQELGLIARWLSSVHSNTLYIESEFHTK